MKLEHLECVAVKYGTPMYLFDVDVLLKEVRRLKEAVGNEINTCYAMKANPFLTEQLAQNVNRIEVCSIGEFQICKRLRIEPEKLLISGVLKKKKEIQEILEYCGGRCVYTAESLEQYLIFARWSSDHQEKLRIYLRLDSGQFGMDKKLIEDIISVREQYPFLKIEGIHFFSGTQKRTQKQIQKEIEYLDDFFMRLEKEYQFTVKELEYGPGFAVPYFRGQECETYQNECIRETAGRLLNMKWRGYITLEMGRILTARCGYYLTMVHDVKKNGIVNYCIVDGGSHHLNYDGQIRGIYQPYIQRIPIREDKTAKEWTVCGALCTTNDILCQRLRAGTIHAGDILVFERTGAYSMTEGMALFLSHELPPVVLYSKKMGLKLVRRRQPVYEWNISKEEENGSIAEYIE